MCFLYFSFQSSKFRELPLNFREEKENIFKSKNLTDLHYKHQKVGTWIMLNLRKVSTYLIWGRFV
jgi:hypothetical protein